MSISDDCALIIRLKYQLVFDVGKIELQISYSTIKLFHFIILLMKKKNVRPNYIQCIHVLLL